MKNLPLMFAILFFVAASAVVGTSLLSPKSLPEALIITPRERDLGTLRPKVVSCAYDIVNGFPYEVEILAVQKSCGCTTAVVDKTALAPRDSAHLTASIDLKGRAGNFASHMTVVYRRAHAPNARIQTTACAAYVNVDPIVHLTSRDLVFEEGLEASKEVGITFTDDRYKLANVTSNHKAFDAALSSDSARLIVRYHPERWSDHNGIPNVTIWTTCPFENRIEIPLIVKQNNSRPETSVSAPAGAGTE